MDSGPSLEAWRPLSPPPSFLDPSSPLCTAAPPPPSSNLFPIPWGLSLALAPYLFPFTLPIRPRCSYIGQRRCHLSCCPPLSYHPLLPPGITRLLRVGQTTGTASCFLPHHSWGDASPELVDPFILWTVAAPAALDDAYPSPLLLGRRSLRIVLP